MSLVLFEFFVQFIHSVLIVDCDFVVPFRMAIDFSLLQLHSVSNDIVNRIIEAVDFIIEWA